MTSEEWRDVPSYPGYQASSLGHVRTAAHKVMSGSPEPSGHIRVGVVVKGKNRKRYVHAMVCEAFHGPCPPGKECRHGDSQPANNVPGNLSWGTRLENQHDRIANGTHNRGEKSAVAILTAEQALRIYKRAWSGEPQADICAGENVTQSTVSTIKLGRAWSSVTGHAQVKPKAKCKGASDGPLSGNGVPKYTGPMPERIARKASKS